MPSRRFAQGAFFAASTLLVAPKLVACGDSAGRLSGEGESCTRTDDCETPFVCRGLVCVDTDATTSASSSTSQGTGGAPSTTSAASTTTASSTGDGSGSVSTTSSASSTSGSTSTGQTWGDCDMCLDTVCSAEEAACDAGCVGIEACIQMVCANLSATGSPEEGQCQVYCQQQFPGSKPKHLDVANCASGALGDCDACFSFPFDFEGCRAFMTATVCQATGAACMASNDCQTYRDCVFTCATLADCLACDDSPAGMAGRPLLEAHEQCIAAECIAEAWLP